MQTIFTVTVFQKISRNYFEDTENYLPEFGDRQFVGWFDNIDEAQFAVENNFGNMHNNIYDYAIIEKLDSGIKTVDIDRIIYKWNNNNYELINIPEELEFVSNFCIC